MIKRHLVMVSSPIYFTVSVHWNNNLSEKKYNGGICDYSFWIVFSIVIQIYVSATTVSQTVVVSLSLPWPYNKIHSYCMASHIKIRESSYHKLKYFVYVCLSVPLISGYVKFIYIWLSYVFN